jgi:hypothetical protein
MISYDGNTGLIVAHNKFCCFLIQYSNVGKGRVLFYIYFCMVKMREYE